MAQNGDAGGIELFDLAHARLNWVDQRQQILSQNIANADTPGYKPRDMAAFSSQLGAVLNPSLSQTDPSHFGAPADSTLAGQLSSTSAVGIDGNAVSVTDELAKVADTSGTQALVENLYSKYMGFFMTALGKSS